MRTGTENILISAYACEPHVGSEPGVGWNEVMQCLGPGRKVVVVTRSGDVQKNAEGSRYIRNSRQHIEEEISRMGVESSITFLYFDLPAWISGFERSMIGDIVNIYLWELLVFFFLRKRFRKGEFDLAKKVTIVSHRYPSFVWYFAGKYIHGPIAGGERFPVRLLSLFSLRNRGKELLRLLFQYLPLLDPLLWLTYSKADQIIAVTEQTKSILPVFFRHKCVVRQAVSLDEEESVPTLTERLPRSSGHLKLLYVGRLLEWKGLLLALKGLRGLSVPYHLDVVGEGAAKEKFVRYAQENGLKVTFHGFLRQAALADFYTRADLFVFPSLRDSGGFVVLEAQQAGLPVLCLDLGGPAVNADRDKGIVIDPAGKSADQIIDEITVELVNHFNKLSNAVSNASVPHE